MDVCNNQIESIVELVDEIGKGIEVFSPEKEVIEEVKLEEVTQDKILEQQKVINEIEQIVEEPMPVEEVKPMPKQVPIPEVINVDEQIPETITIESQPSVQEIKSLSQPEPVPM